MESDRRSRDGPLAEREEYQVSQLRPTRRAVLGGTAAGLAALAAPGLVNAADATRLRLFWWGSQPRADRTFKVMKMYHQANPNVTLDGETVGWSDYWTKLATQIAGRNGPDVMQQDYRYIFEYADRGALADLTPFRDSVLKLKGFSDRTLQGGSSNGKLWGVSLGANSSAYMINVSAFEQAGVDVPTKAMTYDDWVQTAMKVAKNSELVKYGMEDSSGTETVLEDWLRMRGKALYTKDGKLAFDEGDMQDWYDMWNKIRDAGACCPPDIQAQSQQNIATSPLSLGYTATAAAHSNQLVGYQQINKSKITMVPLPLSKPDAKGGQYLKPSQFFSVWAGSKSQEQAAAFIDYFVTNPDAAQVLDVERGVPESSVARKALKGKLEQAAQTQVDFIDGLGDLAGPLPPPPPAGAGEIDKAMIDVGQQVAFGQLTSAEGAKHLVSQAKDILSRT